MDKPALVPLEGKIYRCKECQTPLALCEDVVSTRFYGKEGKAYLFKKVVNVTLGEREERMLLSGVHTVADVCCLSCGSTLGWKYEAVQQESHKYKEGKFILERFKVLGPAENDSDHEAQDGVDSPVLIAHVLETFQKHFKEVQKTLAAHKEWMEAKVSDLTSEVHQLRAKLEEYQATKDVVASDV